jgi:hypothetical protein
VYLTEALVRRNAYTDTIADDVVRAVIDDIDDTSHAQTRTLDTFLNGDHWDPEHDLLASQR